MSYTPDNPTRTETADALERLRISMERDEERAYPHPNTLNMLDKAAAWLRESEEGGDG